MARTTTALAALTGLLLAAGVPAGPANGQEVPLLVGSIQLETEFAGDEPFGRISWLTITAEEEVWVLDGSANVFYLIGVDGQVVTRFGRSGDGPGDLYMPCCLRVDATGRLWVQGMTRLDIFRRTADQVVFEQRLLNEAFLGDNSLMSFGARPPVLLTESNTALVQAARFLGNSYSPEILLVEIDSRGETVRRWAYPEMPEPDWIMYEFPRRGESRPFIPQMLPHGSRSYLARSSKAMYALVTTTAYEVTVHDPDGAVVARISRPEVEGPPVTASERNRAEAQVRQWDQNARRVGGIIPEVTIPARKPPIDRIWFDAEDRLWVSLGVHGDAVMSEADVYDTTGAPLFRAQWPRGVELRHGAARGTVAWGIVKGPLDEPRLALIRFGDQGSRQ
ncbi:MAG: hypothetical protein F4107_05350 [Gemmatimonadetes bacterium]|nr:hypothetical protein [Gemmatimonadota bacterium]MYD13531.1 hypothetical protein [Gemmatimonadota bacterium]MYI65357.1 hypothetical protein [Gemmatimonadota bacterium]